MNMFTRAIFVLCTSLVLGLAAPASAQIERLKTVDPQVCCAGKDAAGNPIFFMAPKSQCRRVVHIDRCKGSTSRPVCCRTPNGFIKVGSADRCKAAGGAVAPDRYCEKPDPVCCKTRNGFVKVQPDRCKAAGGAIVSGRYCSNRKVCCKTPNGFYSWTATQCRRARGKPVSPRYCKPKPAGKICCKYTRSDGTVVHTFLNPRRCKGLNGSKVSNRYCLQPSRNLKLRRN